MKRIISFLLCAVMLAGTAVTAFAEEASVIAEGTCGGGVYWKFEKSGRLSIWGDGTMKNYGYADNNRPPYEEYKEQITSVSIDGISRIGNYAFYRYKNLTGELQIRSNITEIGDCAFEDCSGYTSLCMYEGLKTIGFAAFRGCTGLEHGLVFPNSLEVIGVQAFSRCDNLSDTLNFPDNLKRIGAGAFYSCRKLTGSVVIPAGVTEIEGGIFFACSGLDGTIDLGDTITAIGDTAFSYCSNLRGNLIIPDTVQSIGGAAFAGCSKLDGTLKLSRNLKTIGNDTYGNGTFEGCVLLKGSLELPEGLTSIGHRAFRNCYSLSGVLNLPESLTEIGEDAFHACARSTDLPLFFSEHPEYISFKYYPISEATCTKDGDRRVEIICSECDAMLLSYRETVSAPGHSAETVRENFVSADCTHGESYDNVTRCTVCGEVLSTEHIETQPAGHTPGDVMISNTVAPTCSREGKHTETVICTACGEVISEKTVSDGFGEHSWDEGEVKSGAYDRDIVTDYTCTECGEHRTERTVNPDYHFRCKRCDWYDANKNKAGIFGFVVWMVHSITHMVQQINYMT